MADPPRYPESGDDTGLGPDRGSTTGTPRWVKVFGLIAAVVVVLFVVLLLFGSGGHGPGRHAGGDGGQTPAPNVTGGDAGGHASPSSVTEHGRELP
jgi:hypothetical protein